MQHNGWDHALKVTAGGTGLVGHAGAVLLRKAADQAGLTAQLSGALRRKGSPPAFDRGTVLVSLAAVIAPGVTSMSDIALLAHLAPVQYIDTVHREHAVVETGGVRTAKATGLRNLPSKTWQVNAGWVIAANLAADLAA